MASKIYTKTGDAGKTGLVTGQRVSKASLRIDALGSFDEANAQIGLIITWLAPGYPYRDRLLEIQRYLFSCGSRTAEKTETTGLVVTLPGADFISTLENDIDTMTAELAPLTHFILPGGCEAAARVHVARAVIRRSERALVALHDADEPVDGDVLKFVNRLSDWLFTLARYVNHRAAEEEIIWYSS